MKPPDLGASPPATAVVFDLFGTLVGQFPRAAHDQVLAECSAIVGLDSAACLSAWRRLYDERVTGRLRGIEGHLSAVGLESRRDMSADRLQDAVHHYRQLVSRMLEPSQGALQVLEALRARGVALGLLSNAHDDVASAFASSELASFFSAVTFSCHVGWRKPHPNAFAAVLAALGAPTGATFVGDGSDDELAGAAAAGLYPVLLRRDLTDAYDPDRPEWSGPSIDKLEELVALLVR